MDPITLIISALAAGASAGLTGVAGEAVKDAYIALKNAVKGLLGGAKGSVIVDEFEANPETWTSPMAAELEKKDITADSSVVILAQQLEKLLEARTRSDSIYMPDARGVQIGDHNTQKNRYNA